MLYLNNFVDIACNFVPALLEVIIGGTRQSIKEIRLQSIFTVMAMSFNYSKMIQGHLISNKGLFDMLLD